MFLPFPNVFYIVLHVHCPLKPVFAKAPKAAQPQATYPAMALARVVRLPRRVKLRRWEPREFETWPPTQ